MQEDPGPAGSAREAGAPPSIFRVVAARPVADPGPPAALLSKPALRAAMLARLRALSAGERRERSERLLARLAGLDLWQRARRVGLFAPLRSEPDLDTLWAPAASLTGKDYAYPRVEGHGLTLRVVRGLNELHRQLNGALREPAADAPRLEGWPDLLLVPGLAFTAAGARLGRGGGFYDRLLAQAIPAGCLAVGVGFRFQVVDHLPTERHDVCLSGVLTD